MIKKRSKLLVFSVIFLIIFIGFASSQEEENSGFFSSVWEGIRHVTSSITGWITSIAGLSLEIQLDLKAPNLSIYVLNQSTGIPTLNWTPSNCAGYYIWYSDNVTEILQINYSNYNETTITPNVTLEGKYNNTWNDTTAPGVQKRFYAVAAYAGNITTTSQEKVGKWNVTINDETNIKQTLMSTPLIDNIPVVTFVPPSDFSMIYGVNHTVNNTWDYAYSLSGNWYGSLTSLEYSHGFLFDDFSAIRKITSAGIIPTGDITRVIYSEDNIKQTSLAWESISTNGNISELITPPNDFSMIYTVNDNADDTWDYAYSLSGNWYGPITELKSGKGYLFDDFSTPTNITYERNPY